MGLHRSIYQKLVSFTGMSKPALNVRFPKAIIDQMDELVSSGQYETKAEIINQAIVEFLQRDGLRSVIREEIKRELENQR